MVIPSHFNKRFYMTISDLDETWYASGFVMPEKFHFHSWYEFLIKAKERCNFKFFFYAGCYLIPCNFAI